MEDFILPVVQPNQIGVIDDIWLGTDNILVGQTSSSNQPQLQPESVLLESLEQAATQLQQFTELEEFNLIAGQIFPDRWQPEEGLDLVHDSLIGNIGSETGLVGGEQTWWHEAYSQETETTHLSENLIQENITNPSAITTVIPEETGHYLDSKLAPGDTAGDEGARFAATIQSAAILPSWYSEQDSGTLTIDSQPPQEPQNLSLSNRYTILEDNHFTPLHSHTPGTYGLELRSGRQELRGDWEIGLGTQTSVVGGFNQGQYGWQVDQQGTPTWNDFTLEWSSDTVTITLGDTVVSYNAPWQIGNAIKFYAKQNTFLEIEEIEGLPFAAEAGDVQSTIIAGENLADGWILSGRIAMPPGKGSRHSLLVTVGNVQLDPPAPPIVLEERSDFSPSHRETFVIPDQPSVLGFDYDITFDTTDPDSINDAFEVALVDQTGQSLVHTIQREKDAFFNFTEGENVALAPSVSNSNSRVTLDLSEIEPGTSANLIFRLVNNDGDTSTEVRIDSIEVLSGTDEASSTFVVERETDNPSVDFSALEDVSSSLRAEYGRTSFNSESKTLSIELAAVNQGGYEIREQLLVAIENLSDPSVRVLGFDGLTPEGIPYFDLTHLIDNGSLDSNEVTDTKTIAFVNPLEVQFNYDLIFLGLLNREPTFLTEPNLEGIAGQPYIYKADAADLDEDTLSYSLITGPQGLAVDPETGVVSYTSGATDLGTHAITLLVEDGRGGSDQQHYTLTITDTLPNRPPSIASTPLTEVNLSTFNSGKIVVAHDEWTLSSIGFANAPQDANQFLQNLTDFFVGEESGKFLGYSNNFGITSSSLETAFTEAGHSWTVSTSVPFNLENLLQYDGIFLAGFPANNNVLIDYVNRGGNVYLAAGTGLLGGAQQEAQTWATFLNAFGMAYEVSFNGVGGTLPINATPHPIFNQVQRLYQNNGNSILDLDPDDNLSFIIARGTNGQGLYAVHDTNFVAGENYQYQVEATDPDGDELIYSLEDSPVGMWIDPDSGKIRWAPSSEQVGLHDVTVVVSDGRGGRTEQSFEVLVLPSEGNRAPVIISEPVLTAVPEQTYLYEFQAVDPDGDQLTYYLTEEGPEGLEISPTDGQISWTTTTDIVGPQDVTVVVEDGRGGTDTQSWTIDFETEPTGVVTGRVYSNEYLLQNEELSVTAKVTADNHYGLYYGSPENLNFVGRNEFGFYGNPGTYNWSLPETFTFTVNPNDYLYVVAWDDESGQMWLGEFELPNGVYLRTNKEDWLSVVASGRNPGRTGNVPSPEELKEEILAASWSNPQQSFPNNSTAPWRKIPGISSMSEFIWHDSFLSSATDPYYTIYRSAAPMGSYFASFFEEGLAEQIVYLDENENGRRDVSETYTQTDANGYYSFTLTSGNYNIAFEPQSGWLQLSPESRTYEVTVVDNETLENLDFVAIEGTGNPEDNNPPVLASLPSFSGEVGKQLLYQPLLEDDQGDTQIWDLVVAPDGMVVNGLNGLLSWRPQPNQVGVHDAILRVRDQFGATDIESFQITIEPANQPPIITSKPPEIAATINLPFEYQFKAFDPESEDITFALGGNDFNATIEPETGLFSWNPTTLTSEFTNSGAFPFIVNAVDERGDESSLYFELPVVSQSNAPDNSAPVIHSSPPAEIALGSFYLYQLVVSDPNNDPLTSQIVSGPEGMIIDSNKRVIWTPTPEQFGSNEVVLQVDDSRGGVVQQSFTLEVVAQSRNSSPQITSTPNSVNAVVGREYAYNATALDTDGDLVLWNLEDAPFGMLVDPQLGTVRWNPTIEQIGTHEVTLLAVDSQGAFAGQVFEVTVRGTNLPPAISSTPPTLGAVAQPYNYSVLASDPEGDALSWRLLDAPQGMIIDPHTGLIEWTPSEEQVGSFQVTIETGDAQGATATQTYTLQIREIATNLAPAITSTPSFTWYTGSEYSYRVTAFDPEGDALTFQLLEAPEGTIMDESTGELVWTEPLTGTHPIVVGVNDGQLGAAQRFDLTIVENQAPAFATDSSPVTSVTLGEVYAYDIVAFDPNGTELVYTVDGPDGISIDRLGRLRWTPESSGVYPVTVIVSDGLESIEQSFEISVLEDTTAPSVRVDAFGVYLVGDEFQADIGEEITFQVLGSDNVGISSLQLEVDGVAVPLDRNGFAKITVDEVGTVTATAVGLDAAGNSGTAALSVRVLDFSDTDAPQLTVEFPDTPVTNPIELVGTVTDSNLDYYLLEVAPLEGGEYVEVFRGTGEVIESSLGVLDPTVLANGAYQARLTAVDLGNNQARVEETIYVEGDLKLGNFQLSFTDLTIPVPGIPVTVTRTYDSLTANQQDDLGYGWRLEFRDTNLRTSVGKDENFEAFDITSKGFREGDRVYLTLPGGERETYIFKPRLTPAGALLQALGSASGLATEQDFGLYEPAFVSQSDSNNQLEVEAATLIRSTTGEFTGIAGGLYNPAANHYGGRYTLTTGQGIVYDIDADTGDLLRARDTNGNELNFSDAGITSDSGVEVRFGRDAQGRITRVIDPEGNEIGYEYDGNGDLVGVTDREGNRTGFGYSEVRAHYLDEIIDPLGRSGVRTEYDENGRLSRVLDVNGEAVELVYDPDNSTQTVRDVFGLPTTYVYDERGNVLTEVNAVGLVTERTYDGNDNVLTETVISDESGEEGWTTTYTYDSRGNETSRTDALGNVSRYSYNKFNQLLTSTDELGNTTTYTYYGRNIASVTDALGNVTSYTYDRAGNVISSTNADDKSSFFTYDSRGNVTKIIDTAGNATTYTYDSQGNQISETRAITTPNGVEKIVTRSEYDLNGNLLSATDAENNTTRYEYDKAGNQTAVIDALGRKTEYRYNNKGLLIETIYPDSTPKTLEDNPRDITVYDKGNNQKATINAAGKVTYYNYDAVGRLIETIYPDSTDTLAQFVSFIDPTKDVTTIDWSNVVYPDDTPVYLNDNPRTKTEYYQDGEVKANFDERGYPTKYVYDANNQLIEVIYPKLANNPGVNFSTTYSYDATGRQISAIDTLGHTTKYIYDELGRVVETIFADGTSASSTYDEVGLLISSTDQEGKVTKYEYDNLGRLTDVIQYLNQDSTNPVEIRTEYGYDELGRLIWQEDANDNRTLYEYNKNSRRTVVELPEGQRSNTNYDAVGNIISYTDFNRDTTTYTYDEQNRLIAKQFADNSTISYTYTVNGLRDSVIDSRGTTTYTYDERDRLTSRTDPNGVYLPNGNTIEYTYDAVGNRTSVTTPSGTVDYTFDAWNRLKTVTDSDANITTYFYDGVSNLIQTNLPNGVIETRDYDELNRLIFLENKLGEEVISSYQYTLNDVGHRLKVEEHDGRVVEYEYDDLYRLTEESITDSDDAVNDGRVISYSYDKVGNRLTKVDSVEGTTSYVYNDNDLLLESTTEDIVTYYQYDDNGNLLTQTLNSETTTYIWDGQNRLIKSQTSDGDAVTYEYNDENIRVSSTIDGAKTTYLVDSNLSYAQVLEEYQDDNLKAKYVYGLDLISIEQDGEISIYLIDGLGSTRVLANINGGVVATYNYEAFGNLIDSTGAVENNYLFAGEQFDRQLGQYYLRDRYYDQSISRFTRRDTYEGRIFEPITLHKYLYGNSNPINYVDPSGLYSIPSTILATSIAIATVSNISILSTYAFLRFTTPEASENEWVQCMDNHYSWLLTAGITITQGLAGGIPKELIKPFVTRISGSSALTSLARILSVNKVLRPYSTTYANWLKGRVGIFRGTNIAPSAVINTIYLAGSAYVAYTAVDCAIKSNH